MIRSPFSSPSFPSSRTGPLGGAAFRTGRSTLAASAALLSLSALASAPAAAEPARHALDPAHTALAFLVDHVGFAKTLGRFTDVSGSFVWDPETRELSELRVVVATASVDTDHEARDKHVRDDDFLDVERYPEMIFAADGPVTVADDESRVEGQLTLLGQTRPLALDVVLNKSDKYPFGHERQTLGISARGSLMRSDYGMEYAVANGLVGDEVSMIIEFEALRD